MKLYKKVFVNLAKVLPDSIYLRMVFFSKLKRKLNLSNPKSYNEKLNWLKINDRKEHYQIMVDKYEAKKYVADKIGEQYVIPTLGVWDKFEDINFNELPNQFVLKCTHDSGGLVVCKDKSKLDLKKAKEKIEKSLANNYYLWTREWSYKGVKPRIIAEKYMEDQETGELRDYKFFCFNGEPKLMFVASERGLKNTKFDFYDMQFHHMNIVQHYPNSEYSIEKPEHFEKMVMLAEKLSAGFPHVRVDFYEANGQVYFGEMTFYHFGAIVPFETEEWDKKIGDWLVLPDKIN